MRILHVISFTNPQGGGPIEGVKQLCAPLQNPGITVEIASCDSPVVVWNLTVDMPPVYARWLGGRGSAFFNGFIFSGRRRVWLKLSEVTVSDFFKSSQ